MRARCTTRTFRVFPATAVLTAEHDPLCEEGEEFVDQLRAAGVDVQHRRIEGQTHGFLTMVNVLPGRAEGLAYVSEWVNAGPRSRGRGLSNRAARGYGVSPGAAPGPAQRRRLRR
jgi:acetyl esterase/lipase